MPEAGGDAAMYVNPMDHKDIADKIDTLLSSPTLCATMVEKATNMPRIFVKTKLPTECLISISLLSKKNNKP
ncbi:hypothetical protein SDC9_127217 [bioreactor metagenome]|uniref:Uncharacterized protein n=1 Tax=bioreactor metagenome TaxID=1076179 RepID=A0A645CSR0_9ZZZZ